ncbi:hypothetical protein AB0L05_27055 [Nonomuraea pusilla]|uniref:hypothetical protein n=1 Tax=Nonomuraea pusilla TaxID=46177 RepID=UPI0033172D1B
MTRKTVAGAAVAAAALFTQLAAQPADATTGYSSPCQGVRQCVGAFQDGEGWMVETAPKNWKRVIYQFKHLKKSEKRVCAHEYPRLTMWLSDPGSKRHTTVTTKASGKLPSRACHY